MKKHISILFFILLTSAKIALAIHLNFADSLESLKNSLKHVNPYSSEAGVLKNKISELSILLEHTESAKKYLNENLLLIEQNKLSTEVALVTYDLLGELAFLRKDLEEAKIHYLRSLEISKQLYGEEDCRTALAYSRLGKYFNYRMIADSALIHSTLAVEILKRNPTTLNLVPAEIIFCEAAYATKVFFKKKSQELFYSYNDSARYLYKQALEIAVKKYTINGYQTGYVLHQIANTYTDAVSFERDVFDKSSIVNYKIALKYYQQAFNIYRATIGEYNLKVSNSFYARGLLYEYAFQKDSFSVAQDYYNKAIEALNPNFQITNLKEIPSKISSLNQYQLMILLSKKLYSYEKFAKTLSKEERKNQRLISELTINLWSILIREFNSENSHQILSLYSSIPFQRAIAFKLEDNTKETLNKAFQFADKAKYSSLLKAILKFNPEYSIRLPEVSVEQLQKFLDPKFAFIEYFCSKDEIYAFVISQKTFDVLRLPIPENLNEKILLLRKALYENNIEDFSSVSHELFQLIFKPLQAKIPAHITHLKIVPDGVLSYMPFDALLLKPNAFNNRDFRKLDYLIRGYNISYAFSATLLLMEKVNPKSFHDFVAITPSYKEKNELYFAAKLGETLKISFKGTFLSQDMATSEVFKSQQLNCKVLHLAAHATFDEKNILNSGFFFSDAKGEDKLSLTEISRNSINAQLGVLLGCETGIGIVENGEGIVGLPRAMRMAGIRNIVTTLWQVDDKYSSYLIESFYNKIADGMSSDDAIHQAKVEFMNSASSSALANPFYWAGIIYTGDSTLVEIKKKYNLNFLLGGLPLLFLGLYFFRKKLKLFQ
jgi:CHAT domain-containing protein